MAGQISRRQFLARGGSVVAGFSAVATLGGLGRAAAAVLASSGGKVDNQWIVVSAANPDGTGTLVTVYTGKVELGTGVETALSQIVAEELSIDLGQLAYRQGDTSDNLVSQGYTAGSQTVQSEGVSLRQAAAAAFQEVQALAATYFGVPAAQLTVQDGTFSYRSRRASFGQVIGSQIVTASPSPSQTTKSPADYTVVGQPVPRVDLPSKFFGDFSFSADVRPDAGRPAMLYARVIRPSGRNATFNGWNQPAKAQALALPGVQSINQIGNFVYVLSTDEGTAQLISLEMPYVVKWTDGPALIAQNTLPSALMDPGNVYASDNEFTAGDAAGALSGASQTASAQYFSPFQMHGPMAASAAVADYDGTTITVWSGTQGPYPLQAAITSLIKEVDPSFAGNVRIVYTEQSGCYGHDGADDVSAEVALIAYKTRGPVKLQWMRQEEHQWEPLGPAMVHTMQGGVTGDQVVSWQHDIYSPTHNTRPGGGSSAGNLLVRQYLGGMPAPMPPLGTNTATRNGKVDYAFQNMRIGRHFVKSFEINPDRSASAPLTWVLPRSTALRSLGGFSNSFANESFMDEMALLAGADPLEFRLGYLSGDSRATAVLEALGKAANWKTSPLTSNGKGPRPIGPPPAPGHATGRGIGFIHYENQFTYVATCVDVDVDLSTGQVAVSDAWVVHDCGLVINPNGLENQIQGNVIQGISRTLLEQVDYVGDSVKQNAWRDNPAYYGYGYTVIGFDQVPDTISVTLLDQPSQPPWGAGEPTVMTVPGAVGNAVFAATGVRIRSLPMTPAGVLAALKAASASS